MGCGTTKEEIQSEMLLLQLEKTEIQEERKKIIRQLEELTGKKIIRASIPDYLQKESNNESKSYSLNSNKKKKKKKKKDKSKKELNNKQPTDISVSEDGDFQNSNSVD